VGKIHRNGKSDLSGLAFSNRPLREADEISRRVCLRKLRPVDYENTSLLPQRDLGGGTAPLSLFRRELNFIETPCLPFSGKI